MDIPLGCFTLLSLMYGLEWLRTTRFSDAVKTGLFLAALSLTKNEGIAAASLVFLILIFTSLLRPARSKIIGIFWVLLPLALAGGTWFVFRKNLPAGGSDFVALFSGPALIEKKALLSKVFFRFLLEFIHFERWGFLWFLTAVTAPYWFKKENKVLGVYLFAMFLVLVAAVVVSPLDVEYQMASAVPRLVGQLAPLAAACVGLGFSRRE
jgi:hypothetical protein